jgi:hypothetical protein
VKSIELRERLNLAKEKKTKLDRPDEDTKKFKCFRCQGLGHHQMDYTNIPICYKCKGEGHMAAECTESHDLKMYGFAIADQGFYSIQVPGEGGTPKAASIIQVLQGEASKKKIEEELKNLINNQWDWQVEAKEYVVVFPDKNSLETFAKIAEILMSIHGIKVKIMKSNMDPDASEILQPIWVKIYGLPGIACKEEIVKKVAALAESNYTAETHAHSEAL